MRGPEDVARPHGSTVSPLLEARGISKRFNGIQALSGCSITVGGGEVVGLVGPNGSGKTTLISIVMGLLRPDEGKVLFRGEDVTDAPPSDAIRRPISAAYQNPQVIDSLTVRENMEFGARLKRFPDGQDEVRERIRSMLRELTLDELEHRPLYALSGGQRKLVELGRALIVKPALLLLDEPTAGVSPALEALIGERIMDAARRGAGVLVVSHNLPWTFAISDRVVVLASGEVIAEGTPQEVKRDVRVISAYLH